VELNVFAWLRNRGLVGVVLAPNTKFVKRRSSAEQRLNFEDAEAAMALKKPSL
jgi:hypothetical protein